MNHQLEQLGADECHFITIILSFCLYCSVTVEIQTGNMGKSRVDDMKALIREWTYLQLSPTLCLKNKVNNGDRPCVLLCMFVVHRHKTF